MLVNSKDNAPRGKATHWNYSALTFTSEHLKYIHHRIIHENGACNIKQQTTHRQQLGIFRYTRLVDSSWTFTLSVFLAVLFLSYFCFALLYWLICFAHGDFEASHLPESQEENNFKPCIYDMRNFASAVLFSMEAQHTVGYGIKAPTDECPEAIFVNTIHCLIGFIMQGFMAAIIFSKMTKPRRRSETLMFSRNAVICPRNGKLCFMFRLGDIRTRYLVGTRARAFLVKSTKTYEGEELPQSQIELKLYTDDCTGNVFFNWPLIMYHVIDEDSTLYYTSPSDLSQQKFEIMVIIEGTDDNTGQVTQARSSYLPSEILWGSRFMSMLKYDDLRGEYEVDFSKFDTVTPISTPLCSAAYSREYVAMQTSKTPSTLKLNFTPRQSIGEIPAQTLAGLREKTYTKIHLGENADMN